MGLEFNSDKQYIKSNTPKIIGSDNFIIRSGQGSEEKEIFRASIDPNTKLPRIGINRTGSRVDTITVTSQGASYTSPPIIEIAPPPAVLGAIQATATAILSNGRVIAIVVSNPGSGYTSAPTITIQNAVGDTTGAGAAATCTLDIIEYEVDVNGAIRTSSSIISDTARILNLDLRNFVTADLNIRAPSLKVFDNNSEQVWVANVSLAKNQIRHFESNVYRALNTGITGAFPPLHRTGQALNGTVQLDHIGFRVDDPTQPYYGQLSWPRSITPPLGDNTTKIATTEYVLNLATNDVGGRIYVSQQIGDDQNDGRSVASPVRTIKRACQLATESTNIKETVVIAGGDYLEDNPISIPPDCSVVGDSLRIVLVRPNNPGKDMFKFADKNYISGITFRDKLDTSGNPVSTWKFACSFDDKQRIYYNQTYGGDFKRRFPVGHQIFGKALFRSTFDFNGGLDALVAGETINGVNSSAVGIIKTVTFNTTTGPTAYQKGSVDFETSIGVFAQGESARYYIEAPVDYTGWPSTPAIGDTYIHPNDGITYTWNGTNWAREFQFTLVSLSSIRAEGEVVNTGTNVTKTIPISRIDGSQQAQVGGIIFYTNDLQGVENIHDFHEGQEVFISGLPASLANLNGIQRIYDLDKTGVLIDDDSRSRRFVIPKDNMPGFTDSNFAPSGATVSHFSYYVTLSLLNSPNKFEETPYIARRYQDARNLITNNLAFIKDEAYKQTIAEFPEFTNPDEAKCIRDIGHFVNAIVRDMEYGGNYNTVEAAKYYVIGTGVGYIATELSETIRAFDIARNLTILAMRGWRLDQYGALYNPQFSNVDRYFDPDVTLDPVWPYCANVASAINNLADTFLAIISNNQIDRFVESGYLIARNQEFIKQEASRYIEDAFPQLFLSPLPSAARYKDSTNLIRDNRDEILDRALAEVAVEHPDFYYPGDTQTNAQSRYNDAYRLIQKNKETIIDTAAAEVAVQFPDFFYPGDLQTNERSRYADAYRLIQQNRQEIIDRAAAQVAVQHPDFFYPGDAQTTAVSRFKDGYRLIQLNRQEIIDTAFAAIAPAFPSFVINATNTAKCKRDIGIFIDSVSLDIAQAGGNVYSRQFVLSYFNNGTPITNGLVGEEAESVLAFNKARDEMKKAVANQLTIKDLTVTSGPTNYGEGGNVSNTNSTACSDVQTAITSLTLIITDRITAGNVTGLPAESVSTTVPPGEAKCKRDIGIFVDAISLDVFLGGNSNSINFLKQYFTSPTTLLQNGLVNEIAESNTAFNKARDQMRLAVANQLFAKDLTVTPGSAVYASGVATVPNTDSTACSDIQTYISNLTAIITARLTAGNLTGLPNVNRDYQSRYLDSVDLIRANKEEIKVRAAAEIAIQFPDFFYPGDPQTGPRSRFKDGYRLIQQNRQQIIDTGAAQIAVDHPDFFYPGDAQTNARSRFKDGYRLIQKNRTQIINAAFDSTQAQFPGFTVPGGDINKCKRDIGLFVDAISLDMITGGNQYTIGFIKLYFDGSGIAISNGLSGEEAQSVFAFNEAREQCELAVTNQLAYKDLGITAGPANFGGGGAIVSNTDPTACADVQAALLTLTTLVTTRITAGNINGDNALPTVTNGDSFVTPGEAKCKRDIGLFVDSIGLDIYDGGNQFTVAFTKLYFNPQTGIKIVNGLAGEELESDTAFTKATEMMKKAITNQLLIKDLTITSSTATYGVPGPNIPVLQSGNAAACADVQIAIETLALIAQTRILAGDINGTNALPVITTGESVTPAGEAKCRRDIGLIVDAIVYDLQTGGNSRIIDHTLRYFTNSTTLLSNGLAGQISQSVVAFNKARDWMNRALTNQLYVKDTTITADPNTLSNTSESSCANVRSAVSTLIAILTTTLQAGNTSGLPAVRKASGNIKCRRDLGIFVDAVSLDLFSGSNKYSRKFVLQYFNNNAPISNGLVDEEAQSVVAFNKARDVMKKAVTNGLFYKDLTVTPGPANFGGGGGVVPNTSSTACSDIQSAIVNSTVLITDRITAGNLTGLPAQTVTTYIAGESKCRRDIGIIVDAVASDLYDGGNKNIIRAVKRYFITNTIPLSNGLVNEESQSITAFNKARDVMRLAVTNQLYAKDLTITGDPNPGYLPTNPGFGFGTQGELNNNNNSESCIDVRNSIGTLIAIATTAISAGNLNSLPTVNEGSFLTTTTTKCRRDIGKILGALRRDLILGGNAGIVTAGESYYTGNALTGLPADQILPTRQAFIKVRDLAILAMRNWKTGNGTGPVFVPEFATAPQFIDSTTIVDPNTPTCANVATAITTSFAILDDILANGSVVTKSYGTLYNPTVVYPENTIYDADNKRVSIDATWADLPFIEASPYIQNASVISFLGGGGCEIDGDKVRQPNCPRPGLNPAIGSAAPKATFPNQGKSMVAAQFTIISFGGTGYRIVNDGYTQLVSVFVLFAQDGIFADTGGYASVTNSATNFGTFALRAKGFRLEPYSFDIGTITNVTTTATGRTVFTVGGLGREPLEHYIVKFADYENQNSNIEYFIEGVRQTTVGPPFTSTIDLNEAILLKRKSNGQPITVGNAELVGKQVRLHRPSIVNSSSHTWEYAGSGNDYRALPENGGIKNEALEQVSQEYGRVYTSGTDELGDFKVGYFAKIENRTGNITFTGTVSISEVEFLKLKGGDVVVTGFDASNTLGGNFASDTKISTQKAIKDYISNNLGQYLNKPYSTNAVPRNLVELTDSGKISLDQIPALRPFNVFTIQNTTERLALEGPLAGDIAIELGSTTSFILNNDLESQFVAVAVNTTLQFASGEFLTGSVSTGQGEITEYRQGVVFKINIINQGSGYSELIPPSVSITAPEQSGGVSAAATCTVVNGKVVTVKIVSNNNYIGGFGYTTPPTVTFSAPGVGGTQATAVALIESRVYIDIANNIKITDSDTIKSTNAVPVTVPVTRTVNTSGSNASNWVSLSTSSIAAQDITSGIISTSRLAGNAGEANSFTFLRGDSSFAAAVQSIKPAERRYFDFTTDQTSNSQNVLKFKLNNNILIGHEVTAPGIPAGTTVANTFVTIVDNVSFTVVTLSTSVTQLIPQNTVIQFNRPESPVLLDSTFTLSNFVDKVIITSGGSSYADGVYFDVALSGGTGTGLKGIITVTGGSITSVLVTSGGTGYSADFSIVQMPVVLGFGANAVLDCKVNTSVKNFANVGIDIKRVDDKTLAANEYGNTGVARFKKSQFNIGTSGDGSIELKTGTGSGLDADLLDGQQGLFYRDGQNLINLSIGPDKLGSGLYGIDIAGNSANTLRLVTQVNNPSSSPSPSTFNEGIVADTRNNTADGLSDGGVRHGVITYRQFGTSTDASGGGVRQLAFTDNNNLWIRGSGTGVSTFGSWAKVWTSINDGVGTGLDADVLDGRQGVFYQNGYNINSGIVGPSHLSSFLDATRVNTSLTIKNYISQTFYSIYISGKILSEAPFVAGLTIDLFDAIGIKVGDFELVDVTTFNNIDDTLDYSILTGRLLSGNIVDAFRIGNTQTNEIINDYNISDFAGTFDVAKLESSSGTARLSLGRTDGTASVPVIDFRSSSSPAGLYNVRLAVSGGNSTNGSGSLNILASNANSVSINSNIIWNQGNITFSALNNASTAVQRDSLGNFEAGTITATLTGAASLNVLKTGDTMSGDLNLLAGNKVVINTESGDQGVGTGNKTLTIVNDTVGRDAFLTFHVTGDYAGYFGLDGATNDLFWGGWSVGTSTKYTILHTGNNPVATLNVNNTLVKRDNNGNFSAGTITANLTGNSTTATTLQTARNINGVSFNGSANITITASTAAALSLGTFLSYNSGSTFDGGTARTINVNASSSGNTNIVARDASGNFSAGTITAALTGNATTATTATNLAGGAAGSVPYQSGSGVTTYLANTGAGKFIKSTASGLEWALFDIGGSNTQVQYNNSGSLAGSAQFTFTSGTNSVLRLGGTSSFRQDTTANWTGDAAANEGKIEYHSNRWYINAGSSSAEVVKFRRGGTDVATISNVGAFTCNDDITAFATSDSRLKVNVKPIENALNKVDKISGVTYNWNDKAEGKDQTLREAGVIAQDVLEVLPEIVTQRDNGYYAIKYERLVPLLIEAIKELKQEVETLKNK